MCAICLHLPRTLITGISQTTDIVGRSVDLEKLPIAPYAEFDSYMDQHEDECLPGTRAELRHQIAEWAISPQGRCIFWLNGMAGTGKSTISRTMAKSFKQAKILGASFFFKRGEADRGNAIKLFPTITKQLVANIPQLSPGVREAIHHDPDISTRSLKEQFEKLLLQPLLGLKTLDRQSQTLVIVIDALDECEGDDDIRVILQLLPRLRINAIRLRIFLTSRPELPIRFGLLKILNHDRHDLALHDIPEAVIEHDISLFLNHRFSGIRKSRSLSDGWPGYTNIQKLVALSVPLFIFAATICRIFEDPQWHPADSLAEVLAHQSEGSRLDETYLPVLNRLFANQGKKQRKHLAREFREVVGTIVTLQSPLSVISLSRLTGLSEGLIHLRLNSLYSVLSAPQDETRPVRLFHLSFRDFLLDQETREKNPEFWVDEREIHQKLTTRCIHMCCSLRRNICGLPSAGTPRVEIDHQTIDNCLPPELQYSCRHWAHHLVRSKGLHSVTNDAFSFLQSHFSHWLEAMGILGHVSEVVDTIDLLLSAINVRFLCLF